MFRLSWFCRESKKLALQPREETVYEILITDDVRREIGGVVLLTRVVLIYQIDSNITSECGNTRGRRPPGENGGFTDCVNTHTSEMQCARAS